jgi:hypothetical protein
MSPSPSRRDLIRYILAAGVAVLGTGRPRAAAAPASTGIPGNQPAVTYYHSYDLDGQERPRQETCIVYDALGRVTCTYSSHDAPDASIATYCLPERSRKGTHLLSQFPYRQPSPCIRLLHATSSAQYPRRLRLPRSQPGGCAPGPVPQAGGLRRLCARPRRGTRTLPDPNPHLLPDADPVAFRTLAPARRLVERVPALADVDALCPLADALPRRRQRSRLPEPLQGLPGRDGSAPVYRAALRGTQRPSRRAGAACGRVALVESGVSPDGGRGHPAFVSLAGAGTGELDLMGGRTADRGGVGGHRCLGDSRLPIRVSGLDGYGRTEIGVAGHDATAWATAQAT